MPILTSVPAPSLLRDRIVRPPSVRSATVPALMAVVLQVGSVAAQRPPAPASVVEREPVPAELGALDRSEIPTPSLPEAGEDPVAFFAEARFKGDVLAL